MSADWPASLLSDFRHGELCVGDLVNVLRVPQPTASRHLAYLRKSGLVVACKQGLWIHYSLAPAQHPFHQKLLECIECCLVDVPELKADAKRLGRIRTSGSCCPR